MARRHWDFLTGDRAKDQRNVEVLLESVEALYARQRVDERVRSAVDRALLVSGAEVGVLLLPDPVDGLRPYVVRGRDGNELPLDTPYSTSITERVWLNARPFVAQDFANSSSMGDLGQSIPQMQLLSVMGVPLPVEGRNLGVLYVHSQKANRSFGDSDLSVFQVLGSVIGHALERARMRIQEEEKKRLEADMAMAQKVQEGFLPAALPQPEGFDIAGVGRPCDETSGDYYDVIPQRDGRYALIIGDVSNHGLGPALVMASTRAYLHGLLGSVVDPEEVMASTNDFLVRDTRPDTFMTMFLASLDPETREFRYVSAGHNSAFLVRPGEDPQDIGAAGMVLGVAEDESYAASEPLALPPGTALLLHTDGIQEARNEEGAMYGEDVLRASFVRHATHAPSAQAIVDGVLSDLRSFVGTRKLDDDVTCLVVLSR